MGTDSRLHAGTRFGWRHDTGPTTTRPAPSPSSTITAGPVPHDRREADAADIETTRRVGTGKALGYLSSRAGTPTYRRTRALLAMCRAVESQAKIAGLGHLHIGTVPCGPACEWPDWQRSGASGVAR